MTNHPNRSKPQQEAKHTPGPWRFHRHEFGEYAGNIIADLPTPPNSVQRIRTIAVVLKYAPKPEAIANGELLGTAPETAAERDRLKALNVELLAALKAASAALRNNHCRVAANAADTIIAKAEGR